VVAEINHAMPAPPGAPKVPLGRVDYAIETDRPLPNMPTAPTSPAVREIGRLIAELVDDGDCIETGIGAIPSAVLAALGGKNDLGLHSGMIADGVMDLAEAGVLTGAAKPIDRGKIVTGLTLGSAALYDWAGRSRQVRYRAVDYTHDVGVIRRIDNFVAINSALEVDLFGQVNAEMLAGRQVSGTGGAVDFMRGAARAKGGRSIVALTATAARGSVSRIVPALAAGTAATALRTDVDYVITEFGAARLRHLPVAARAEALIAIAAPDFRDELRERWRALSRAPS
jgi:4-hydroxybutyrate CoA-transferase